MTPTPRTDAIAHRGYNESAYISEMTGLSRQLERENQTFRAAQKACEDCDAPRVDRIAELERELAESTESLDFQTQLNREVIELEKKTLGERNDARAELASLKATIADPDEVELAMIRGEIAIPDRAEFDAIRETPVGYNPSPTDAEIDAHLDECVARSAIDWKEDL
jgi:hypothetical protein